MGEHYQAAKKMEKDPNGGSWPAYPSGKSWDEPSGKTGSGKKFYHNILPGSSVKSEPFYVAIITPVIHYCVAARAACKWMFGARDEFRSCPIPKEIKELTK